MGLLRKTYAEINLKNVKENVNKIINKYKGYNYYFGVVKADCYGHGYKKTVQAVIDGGCNYLAVATLEEAIKIRAIYTKIPILCLGVIDEEFLKICEENNITITIGSLSYLKNLKLKDYNKIKVHLKINTGMNRLGISNGSELEEVVKILKDNNIEIEGIYTHIYNALNEKHYEEQVEKFKNITKKIDIRNIKIVHISASEATMNYPKLDFANGCRLGIVMYGFYGPKDLNLKSTFALKSEVIQINEIKKGETVGYNGTYSNLAIITHSHSEFIIDFATILPGLPKPDISNRIVMTPEHAKRLLNALMDNVTKYESQFGLINLGGGQAQQGGTFNLGDLPQFGPNGAKS